VRSSASAFRKWFSSHEVVWTSKQASIRPVARKHGLDELCTSRGNRKIKRSRAEPIQWYQSNGEKTDSESRDVGTEGSRQANLKTSSPEKTSVAILVARSVGNFLPKESTSISIKFTVPALMHLYCHLVRKTLPAALSTRCTSSDRGPAGGELYIYLRKTLSDQYQRPGKTLLKKNTVLEVKTTTNSK
jgi:hypothetical protein